MSDRELLEAAAKAAGLTVIRSRMSDPLNRDLLIDRRPDHQPRGWNPLTRDGDSARLEARLQMHVEWHPATEEVVVGGAELSCKLPYGNDKQAARRRAGVCAAAALAAPQETTR